MCPLRKPADRGSSQVRSIGHNIIDPRLAALNSKELPMRRRTAILAQDL